MAKTFSDLSSLPVAPGNVLLAGTPSDIGGTIESTAYALAAHSHGSVYALLNHNHDVDYSSIDHNHDSEYAPINRGILCSQVGYSGDDTFSREISFAGVYPLYYWRLTGVYSSSPYRVFEIWPGPVGSYVIHGLYEGQYVAFRLSDPYPIEWSYTGVGTLKMILNSGAGAMNKSGVNYLINYGGCPE